MFGAANRSDKSRWTNQTVMIFREERLVKRRQSEVDANHASRRSNMRAVKRRTKVGQIAVPPSASRAVPLIQEWRAERQCGDKVNAVRFGGILTIGTDTILCVPGAGDSDDILLVSREERLRDTLPYRDVVIQLHAIDFLDLVLVIETPSADLRAVGVGSSHQIGRHVIDRGISHFVLDHKIVEVDTSDGNGD